MAHFVGYWVDMSGYREPSYSQPTQRNLKLGNQMSFIPSDHFRERVIMADAKSTMLLWLKIGLLILVTP